jgi:hypothetical protein
MPLDETSLPSAVALHLGEIRSYLCHVKAKIAEYEDHIRRLHVDRVAYALAETTLLRTVEEMYDAEEAERADIAHELAASDEHTF